MRVAVVGAGPAGIYAAEALATDHNVEVDVFDTLPVPCGLVRYGVAPDHFSIRSVRDKLVETLDHPKVRFFGNVTVGTDISAEELTGIYDAVIYTYGASQDRALGIEGEDSDSSFAATEFVKWYTGHPDAQDFSGQLARAQDVVVIGLGNVAVDVTRVLIKPILEMNETDMPEHVLKALRNSTVRRVHVVGRRGPHHATFTTKELKELGELEGVSVNIMASDLPSSDAEASDGNRVVERNLKVVRDWAERDSVDTPKAINFRFYSTPLAYSEQDSELIVERMTVLPDGAIQPSGELERIPADLVIRSVGYKGTHLPGVPFDSAKSVIPSVDGRIIGAERSYVAGWIKRGPSGIIGTNKKDAVATVATLMADLSDQPSSAQAPDYVVSLLKDRGIQYVDISGWKRIDAAERELGSLSGKERTTIHERKTLLSLAKGN
jgi:ferredoxin--NADP+ reductase